jgi:NAD-dependent SIR2 family protein deacetylase
MATYHGLIKLNCLVCNWQTTDDRTIEIFNDLGGGCPDCENEFYRWENEDGSIVVSLSGLKDNIATYDNLVFKGEN